MTGRSKPVSFIREAGLGFVLSAAAAAAATAGLVFFPAGLVIRAVTAAVALAYIVLTIGRSAESAGRIVTVALCLAAIGAAWLSGFGVAGFLAVNVGLIWLVRALYVRSGFIDAVLDFCLLVPAAGFAAWAALRTQSIWLACWSFFVLQALHVGIPALCARVTKRAPAVPDDESANRRFCEASRTAEEALRRIAALH